jgi:hypothetical protein
MGTYTIYTIKVERGYSLLLFKEMQPGGKFNPQKPNPYRSEDEPSLPIFPTVTYPWDIDEGIGHLPLLSSS